MAQEQKRGCGYRKVGGLYLVGGYIPVHCDRLPYPLDVCPVCGGGIKVGRGFTKINPAHLFGIHPDCRDSLPCMLCQPPDEAAFLLRVSKTYYPTPEDFMEEGINQGISKRISSIPRDFELGHTILFLVHDKACIKRESPVLQHAMAIGQETTQERLIDSDKEKYQTGIFTAFRPQRIEKLYWQSELDNMSEEDLEKLRKRGITPVGIKDGDKDHM